MNIPLYKKNYSSGTTLYIEGDPGDNAYVIERGCVQILKSRNGVNVVIAELTDGELFGEMALIDNLARTATVVVKEDCTLIEISRDQLHERIRHTDPTLTLLLRLLMQRYRSVLDDTFDPVDDAGMGKVAKLTPLSLRAEHHQQQVLEELVMEQELRQALEANEFELYYQPIVRIATGRAAGFETLIRWNHPEQGVVPPLRFIEIAEKTGLIIPIGSWVLERTCESMVAFQEHYQRHNPDMPALFMNVNVSGVQLLENDFAETTKRVKDHYGIEDNTLKIEITESSLVEDPDSARRSLDALKANGMHIVLDDFGTGYSSLSYLHRFPIDTLKIDRSFISTMHEDRVNMEIVRSVTGLAHKLDMAVVAEGIETSEHLFSLHDIECEFGQGYYFSKPLPEDGALEFLACQLFE